MKLLLLLAKLVDITKLLKLVVSLQIVESPEIKSLALTKICLRYRIWIKVWIHNAVGFANVCPEVI